MDSDTVAGAFVSSIGPRNSAHSKISRILIAISRQVWSFTKCLQLDMLFFCST